MLSATTHRIFTFHNISQQCFIISACVCYRKMVYSYQWLPTGSNVRLSHHFDMCVCEHVWNQNSSAAFTDVIARCFGALIKYAWHYTSAATPRILLRVNTIISGKHQSRISRLESARWRHEQTTFSILILLCETQPLKVRLHGSLYSD